MAKSPSTSGVSADRIKNEPDAGLHTEVFQILRNIGVALAAVSAAVFASPVAMPTVITDVAGYLAVAGSVMGAVSQTAVLNDEE